jgi:hypothetical protein
VTPVRLRTHAVILWCAAGMAGCGSAPGQRHAYHVANPQVMQRGSLVLALAVQDWRPYVATGEKRSTFVGLSRQRYGQPSDVKTVSGASLATDFASSIGRGLKTAGYKVTTVDVGDRSLLPQVRLELLRTGAQRGLAVQIQQWRSDTYSGTALDYDVALAVFDAVGQEIGRTAIKGHDVIVFGGHFIDPDVRAEKAVSDAYARKLEELLNAPAIRRALAPPTGAPPEPPPAGPPKQLAAPPAPTSRACCEADAPTF